ncbi:Muc16 [Phodopus roborovskii]|uniref:Muc16 protein n=1 Tax=Phodopus roborovskii TaxID=109678 RepID=A0AAU9YRT5_PHORO|nr:Muc16 [Phodopus roborovskii]
MYYVCACGAHKSSTLQEPHSSTGFMASVVRTTPGTSTRMLDTRTAVTTSTLYWRSSIPSKLATLKVTRKSQKAVNSMESTSSAPHISFESVVPKTTLSTLIPEATGKSTVSVSVNTSNSTRIDTHNGAELNSTALSDTSTTVTMMETNMPEVISTTEHTPSSTKIFFIDSVLVSRTETTNNTSYSSPHQPIKPEETSSEMSTGSPNSITSTEITTNQSGHDITSNMLFSQGTPENFSVPGMLSSVSQSYPLLEKSTFLSTSYNAPSKTKPSALEHSWGTTVRTSSSSPVNSTSKRHSHSFAGSMNSPLVVTSNVVTSESTSTTASNRETQHTGTQTFLLSESIGHSTSSLSPSWTHSTWKGSRSAKSSTPIPEAPSHSPVPASADKYSTNSPVSITSVFTVSKNLIPTKLFTTSGSVTLSIPSSNTELSKISQTTSVSSPTPVKNIEDRTYTSHAQHNIMPTSVSPEKESFTTNLSTMEHTRHSPSQPISSESAEIETGTASSQRTAWADFSTSKDINSTTKHSTSQSELPTSPSLFQFRTGILSADHTLLSVPHQSTSEDTSIGISTSLPTSTISTETKEMTSRSTGHSPVTSDILTYPDTSLVKDIHSSEMHTFPHSESVVPINSPASASWTLTPEKGSISTDSTTIPELLSLTPDASLTERHSIRPPVSVASVFTVTKYLFPTASHTSADPVTAYIPSWSSISQPRSKIAHYSQTSQKSKFSSVTPGPKMEASSSGSQFKYTNTPTSVSSENKAFTTTLPTAHISTLSPTQSTLFDNEKIGTQSFTLLTTQTQANIPEKVYSSTDFISSHSEMPYSSSLPVSRTVSMSLDNTTLPTLQQFTSEDTSSGIVTKLYGSNITESEELSTSKIGDSKVTSNMVLSLEASPMSSVSDNITSFIPTSLVTETSTFLSQSYEVPSIAPFPDLKGSQPANSPGYHDGPTLTSPINSTAEHSTPSPSSVISAFTSSSREAITTWLEIHNLSTSFPNWSSSMPSSQETSQVTEFSQTSSDSSLKAKTVMEARSSIPQSKSSITPTSVSSKTAFSTTFQHPLVDTTVSVSQVTFSDASGVMDRTASMSQSLPQTTILEETTTATTHNTDFSQLPPSMTTGISISESMATERISTKSPLYVSASEDIMPGSSPRHITFPSTKEDGPEEQSHESSLLKEKHSSSDSTPTMIEKNIPSPVTPTPQAQNVSSLAFVAALVTAVQRQKSNNTGLSTLSPSYNIRNIKKGHIFSKSPESRVETNSPRVHPQGTLLDNSVLSRLTTKDFPLTSVKQEFTMPENTNLMTKPSSDLFTVPTRISTGLSRTEANSTDRLSVSSSTLLTKTTDISTGNSSSIYTLSIPNIDMKKVINATESSKITTVWNTSGTIADTQALSTVTKTVLQVHSMTLPNSSESLSWTDFPSHEAPSSVNSAEIYQTTSHFPATSTSEGQSLSSTASMASTFSSKETTAKDTNLASLTTLFPSWKSSELAISKDTRTSQTSYMFTRSEVTSEDISTSGPQFQNTVSLDAVSHDGTASSLLTSPTKTSLSSAYSLSPQSSNSISLPEMSFLTSEFSKTTDTLGRSLDTGTSLPPNLSSTSLEIFGLPEVNTDTEKFHSSSKFEVTSMKTISTGHELSSTVPTPPESSRDTYTVGTSYILVSSMSTSLPAYLETTRSDTEQVSHLTTGLRDISISLQTNIPSAPLSTPVPKSETAVTSAMSISTPYQTPSSKFTEIPLETVTIVHPYLSTIESTVATSFSESNFSMPSSESTHVPRTNILPTDETTLIETTTLSPTEEMPPFAITSTAKGNSAMNLSSPHSVTQSSHVDVLVSTTTEKLPSSTSTPVLFSASTSTDFTSIPALHGIPLSETEDGIQSHTETPDGTTRGNTTSLGKAPLASISLASPKEPSTEAAAKEDTTTTALKFTPSATSTTKISTTTSKPLIHLKTAEKTGNINATEMIITASDASHTFLGIAALFSTGSGENASLVLSTRPSFYSTESESTASWSSSLRTETSPDVYPLHISSGESESVSLVTHPLEITSAVANINQNGFQDESDSIVSTATTPREEASSDIPAAAVSPLIPNLVTSLITRPKESTILFTPTLTDFLSEPKTTGSGVTHSGAEVSYSVPTTFSTDTSGMATSLDISSGAETKPALQSLTFESHTTVSTAMHLTQSRILVSENISDIFYGESDTTTLTMDTTHGTEIMAAFPTTTTSPGMTRLTTSLDISSQTQEKNSMSTMTPDGEPESITIIVTDLEAWGSTAILNTTTLAAVSGKKIEPTISTFIAFPSQPFKTASWTTQTGSEVPSAIPNVHFSSGEPNTTTLGITHPTETSFTVPKTDLTVYHGGSNLKLSTTTSTGEESSSDLPETGATIITHTGVQKTSSFSTMTASSGILGIETSLVPSSEIYTSIISPTITKYSQELEKTTSQVTISTTSEDRFPVTTLTTLSGKAGASASFVTNPEETHSRLPRTSPRFSHIESHTIPSTTTAIEQEAISFAPTISISNSIPNMVTLDGHSSEEDARTSKPITKISLISHAWEKTSSPIFTTTVSPGVTEIRRPLFTSSETWIDKRNQTISPGQPETTTSWTMNPGIEVISRVKPTTISPSVLDTVTSKSVSQTPKLQNTISLVTDVGEVYSSAMSTLADFAGNTEVTTSMITNLGSENHATTSTLPFSSGPPETTISWMNKLKKEATSGVIMTNSKPSVTDMMTSTIMNHTPSEAQNTTPLATHAGKQHSLDMNSMVVTQGITEMTSLVNSSGKESHAVPTNMALIPIQPETTTNGITHPTIEDISGMLSTSILPTVPTIIPSEPDTEVSLVTNIGKQSSSSRFTRPISANITKMIPSLLNTYNTEKYSVSSTLDVSLSQPENTDPWLTHSGKEATLGVLTTTISAGIPEMITSTNFIPSEPHTTRSLVTHIWEQPSLTMSTRSVPPGITEMIPTLVTSSGTESHSLTSTRIVSPDKPGTIGSWVTNHEKEGTSENLSTTISTAIPDIMTSMTLNYTPSEPQTKAPLVTYAGRHPISSMSTQAVSSDITEIMPSQATNSSTVTHEDSSTLLVSPLQTESTASWTTHMERETTSDILNTTISASVLDLVTFTSLIPSETHSTVSSVTHIDEQPSSAISTLAVSPGITKMIPALLPSSGTKHISTATILAVSIGQPETTDSWVTHPVKAVTSDIFSKTKQPVAPENITETSLLSIPSETQTIIGVFTHAEAQPSSSLSTLTVSSGVTEMMKSQATTTGTKTHKTSPPVFVPPGQTETSWTTHAEREEISVVLNTTNSTSVSDLLNDTTLISSEPHSTVSFAIHNGEQFNPVMPTLDFTAGVTEMTPSLVTKSTTQNNLPVTTLEVSTEQTEITTLWVTHLGKEGFSGDLSTTISPSVSDTMNATTLKHTASETQFITSLVTPASGHPSSSMSTQSSSSGLTEMTPLLVTSLGTGSYVITSTLDDSMGQTTSALVTHPEREATPGVLTTTISTGVPEMMTARTLIPSDPHNTISLVTHIEGQPSSTLLTKPVSPGLTEIIQSLVTKSSTKSHPVTSTLCCSPGQPGTMGTLVTRPGKKDTSGDLSTTISTSVPEMMTSTTQDHFEIQTIASLVTHTGGYPTSSIAIQGVSSGVTKMMPSQAPSSSTVTHKTSPALFVSQIHSESTASWTTHREREATSGVLNTTISASVPDLVTSTTLIPSEPHSTVSFVTHIGEQLSSSMPTPVVSPGITKITPSLIPSSGTKNISTATTLAVSQYQLGTTGSWVSHSGKEGSSVLSTTISPSVPDMMTSTSLTSTPSESQTITTLDTHAGGHPSLSMSTQYVSSRVTEMTPSLDTDLGIGSYAVTSTLDVSIGEPETTATLVTHPEREVTSGVPTNIISTGVPEVMTKTTLNPSESHNTLPLLTHIEGEPSSTLSTKPMSPGMTEIVQSLVTSSSTESHSMTSTVDVYSNQPGITAPWVNHLGKEGTSGILSTTISPSISEMMTSPSDSLFSGEPHTTVSLVTHIEGQPSSGMSTKPVSLGLTEIISSLVTSASTESHSVTSTVAVSPDQPGTTGSWATHPGKESTSEILNATISPAIPDIRTSTTLNHTPSEEKTITSLVTYDSGHHTLSTSTHGFSSGITEMTTTQVTSSSTVTYETSPALFVSPLQTESIALRTTHAERETTSGVLNTTISANVPDRVTSTTLIPSEPHSTVSFFTHISEQPNSTIPTLAVSSGITRMTPSLVPSSGTKTISTATTLAVSTDQPEATGSWVTHSVKAVTSDILTTAMPLSSAENTTAMYLTSAPSETQTITALVTHHSGYSSSSMSIQAVSSGVTEMKTLQDTTTGTAAHESSPALFVSPGQTESTASVTTHAEKEETAVVLNTTISASVPNLFNDTTLISSKPHSTISFATQIGEQFNSVVPTLAVSQSLTEMMLSPGTSYAEENNSTLAVSTDHPGTTTPLVTYPGKENSSGDLSATISPSVPDMITSTTLNHTPSEPQVTASLVTPANGHPSLSMSTLSVSSGETERVPSLVTSLGTGSYGITSTLDISIGQPETTATLVTHHEREAISGVPTTIISTGVPEMMTATILTPSEPQTRISFVTSAEGETSLNLSTMVVSPNITEIMTSQATASGTETHKIPPVLFVSPGPKETTASWVTHIEREATLGSQTTTISTNVPDEITSLTLIPSEAHTAVSLVTDIGEQPTPATFTMPVSPGITEMIPSLVTSSGSESHPVTSTLAISLGPTAPLVTYPGKEGTSMAVTTTISPSTDTMTSISLNHTPSKPQIITSITHAGGHPSSSMSTKAVSPGITEMKPSVYTGFGTESYAKTTILAVSSGLSEITVPWATNPGREGTLGVLSTTISPSVPEIMSAPTLIPSEAHTAISLVTDIGEQPSSAMSTSPASLGITEMIPSLVTSSGSESHVVTSTMAISPGQTETTALWSSRPRQEDTSGVVTLAISPSASGLMTSTSLNHITSEPQTTTLFINAGGQPTLSTSSLAISSHVTETIPVTSSGVTEKMTSPNLISSEAHTTISMVTHTAEQLSSTMSTRPVSSHVTETRPSLATRSHKESDLVSSTLAASTSQQETTASWVTLPVTEATSSIPRTPISPSVPDIMASPTLFPSEPYTTMTLESHIGGESSSGMSTRPVPPSMTEMMTSLVTTSETETHSSTLTLSVSTQTEATASWVSHPGKEATSTISTLSTLLGEPKRTETWLTLSAKPNTPLSTTTPTFSYSESDITPSASKTEATPAIPKTLSSGVQYMTTPLVPGSTTDNSMIFLPLSTLMREPTSAVSSITQSTLTQQTSSFSDSGLDITTSIVNYPGIETNSSVPTMTVSSGAPGVMISQFTSSGPSKSAFPATVLSPSKPKSTASLTTLLSPETNRTLPVSTGFPSTVLETTSSEPITPRVDSNATLLTQTISSGGPEMTKFLLNSFVTEDSRNDLGTTFSSSVSEKTASLSIHSGTDTNTTILTVTPSLVLARTTGFWTSIPSTESTLTIPHSVSGFPGAPTTSKFSSAILQSTESSASVTTVRLPNFVSDVTSPVMTLISSESSTISLTDLETTSETSHLATTSSRPTEAKTTTTLHGSPFAPMATSRLSTWSSENVTSRPISYHKEWAPKNHSVCLSPTPTLVPVSPLVHFTVNFTITNLKYEEGMHRPGSWKFNATERILQRLLWPLFNKTKISLLYSGCRLISLRPEKDEAATGVDAICSHHPDPTGSELDNEQVYWELRKLTNDVTQLGPYTLDQNSLYINGYTHQVLGTTTKLAASIPVTFTINFTVINLEYVEEMGHPGSRKFNATERILKRLLRTLFSKTSLGPQYEGCRLTLLREHVYWELKRLNDGSMQLGPYTLDHNSLYVNAAPVLLPFIINFTIINLEFEEDMGHPGSRKFNITERTLQRLLRFLFNKTSIGPLYAGCRLILLRREKDGAATGVDATCTYHLDPTGHRLENEQLYGELSSLTQGVTQLGPYFLDQNSLYVNGYTHQILATTPRMAAPIPVTFTINFTVINLEYVEEMGHPGSRKFNATERILQRLLRTLFSKTSLGPQYEGCRLTLLRPEDSGAATGVDAICIYHPNTSNQELDREHVYWELKRLNDGSMQLGPYTLDHNSLYVNGYTQQILATTHRTSVVANVSEGMPNTSSIPTAAPVLLPFIINFTIINLEFEEDMGHPGSRKFNITERTLQRLLRFLFNKTSIGPLYAGCRLILLRREKDGAATGVDATCTYHLDPTGHRLENEQLYGELSSLTQGVTQLGPYFLDQNSLYVNGYTHQILATTPRMAAPIPVTFTINFTVINLEYVEEMDHPGSRKFNATVRILQRLLRFLFNKTSIGPLYAGCRLILLRREKDGAATGVDAICTYHLVPTGHRLENEQLYGELSSLTQGVTQLGPYFLDQNSLYVNGYTHQILATTPRSDSALLLLTLNFTITNLPYTKDMWDPGYAKFNKVEKVLQLLLKPLLQNTSVGLLYSGCRLTSLSPRRNGEATGVDIVCTYHPDHIGHDLAREQLYLELSKLTYGVTQLGPYTLDQDSLYVNASSLAPSPTTNFTGNDTIIVPITLNFTITNLHYTEEMGHPGSLKFNSTKWILHYWFDTLLNKTSIAPQYSGCRLASLRSDNHRAATGVDIICTFHSDPMSPVLDQDQLFWELSHETHGITRLGPYTLDQNSLYINGDHFGGAAPTTTTGEVNEEMFTVNFTINNLRYSADMGQVGSPKFNITDTLMQHLLRPLFQRSSLGPLYTGCRVATLRSVKNGAQTQVDVLCTYHQVPNSLGLPAKSIFYDLSWQTHGITQLGPYSLDKDSLYINGYNEPGPDVPPTTPEPATTILPSPPVSLQPESSTAMWHHLETFTINFTISNLQYSADMISGSAMFNSIENVLQHLLGALFQNSSLNSSCRLVSLRPEKNGTFTGVVTTCTYQNDTAHPGMDTWGLYSELSLLSHGVTQLGNYTLENHSLYVNGYNGLGSDILTTTPEPSTTILPFTLTSMQPESATAVEHHLKTFTISFTISNLPYSEDMSYSSVMFNSTESVLQNLLIPLLQNISFNPRCRLISIRPEKNQTSSNVNVICSYQHDSTHPGLYTEELYLELSNLTYGVTQLGNYTLDKDSLYVNGYSGTGTEEPITNPESATTITTMLPSPSTLVQTESTTALGHHLKIITVSFTISNLPYSANMNNGSAVFNSTETLIKNLMEPLLHNASFNSSCRLDSLRPDKNGTATGVEAICTYLHDPANPGLDTQELYSDLSKLTHGITQLGNYTLDKESLHVNCYNKPGQEEPSTTPEPATTMLPSPSTSLQPESTTAAAMGYHQQILTINFTITNLPYSSNMSNASAVFSSTESVLQHLLEHLFQNGSFNSSCRLDSLRPKKNGTATGVDAICAFYHDPAHPWMDIQELYSQLKNLTQGITQLGNYSLDKDSLFVNGYNDHGAEGLPTTPESPTTILASPSTSMQPEPTTAMEHLKTFTLNFTISNLPYSADMSSAMFNSTERILQHLLGPFFQNESLYSDCKLVSLRSKKNGTATGVNAICSYHHNPAYPELDIQELYTKLSQLIHGVTHLGSYMLDQNSLYVNGYTHKIAGTSPSDWEKIFTNPTSDRVLISKIYKELKKLVTKIPNNPIKKWVLSDLWLIKSLHPLFHNGSQILQRWYMCDIDLQNVGQNSSRKGKATDNLSSVSNSNHTGVDSVCNFSPLARQVDRVSIYKEFLRMTQNGTQLLNFTLDRKSVLVDGYCSSRDDDVIKNSGLPFWAIILICLAVLLILITCLMCCFLHHTALRWSRMDLRCDIYVT